MRRIVVGDRVHGHVPNHLAAALEGRHAIEPLLLAVEDADARGAVELVAGHHEEVGVEIPHVHVEMHGGLRPVDEHRNAPSMRRRDDLLHRQDCAERVRHLRDGDHLGARREQRLEFLEQELAPVVHRRPFQDRALALAEIMPRHDVRVVLHDGEHDLVTLADAVRTAHPPEAIRHEIVRRRGVAGEDDLVRRGGIEKGAHGLAGVLERLGRHVGHVVQATMDVGVAGLHHVRHCIDHGPWLLRRGSAVEIDERLAIDLLRQDREIAPHGLDIVGGGCGLGVHGRLLYPSPGRGETQTRAFSQPSTTPISASPTSSCSRPSSTASPRNDSIKSASASGRGRPRAMR